MRCGKESHPRKQCSGKVAECHRCKRKGHYEAVCRLKTVADAMEADAMDAAFLDNVAPGKQETIWIATIQLNGKQVPFKFDTEVTAITNELINVLGNPPLTPQQALIWSFQTIPAGVKEVQRHLYLQGNTSSATCVCSEKAEKKPARPASYHHIEIGSQNGCNRTQPTKRIPQSLQRTREPWRRVHHPADA